MNTNDNKTLRDEFAMAALTGMLANTDIVKAHRDASESKGIDYTDAVTHDAYSLADEMMKQRTK